MATLRSHFVPSTLSQQPLDAKYLASRRVAQAAREAETAVNELGKALLDGAHVLVSETVQGIKARVSDAQVGMEGVIARVPAVGPLVAMELYRATHTRTDEEEEMPLRPTNREEPSENATQLTLEYLECIGS
jgi:hypothetical protein